MVLSRRQQSPEIFQDGAPCDALIGDYECGPGRFGDRFALSCRGDRVASLILTRVVVGLVPVACFGQAVVPASLLAPITGTERLKWFAVSTVGPTTLAAGVISAGWGTLYNSPREYGPHWKGFGQRYGMRLTGISTGNAIEAGLGAIWREDPRYTRVGNRSFGRRVRHIVTMTFMAPDDRGQSKPAFARYAAISGNNFLSNTWRESSEATYQRAALRTGLGFLARMAGNAFEEFWPDVKRKLHP